MNLTRFFIAIACFLIVSARAQDLPPETRMSLEVLTPLNFSYANAMDVLQQKVLPRAIKMVLKVKQESVIVSGQVYISNASSSPFANNFVMKMSQTNSVSCSSAGDVSLSTTPATLFMQPRSSGGVKFYEYYFDVKLNPPQTFGGPALTNFALVYTISLQ